MYIVSRTVGGIHPMTTILDPTDERKPVVRAVSPRPDSLTGRIALLDIAKPRGNVLLDRLEELLRERHPGLQIARYSKPTFTKPAPVELRERIRNDCDLVVEALAD